MLLLHWSISNLFLSAEWGASLFCSHIDSHFLAVFIDNVSFPHNVTLSRIDQIFMAWQYILDLSISCCFNYYSFINTCECDSIGLSSLFFKVVLAIPGLLIFHMNFRIRLSSSLKNSTGSLWFWGSFSYKARFHPKGTFNKLSRWFLYMMRWLTFNWARPSCLDIWSYNVLDVL